VRLRCDEIACASHCVKAQRLARYCDAQVFPTRQTRCWNGSCRGFTLIPSDVKRLSLGRRASANEVWSDDRDGEAENDNHGGDGDQFTPGESGTTCPNEFPWPDDLERCAQRSAAFRRELGRIGRRELLLFR
jgi:hypothetical protein